MSIYEESQIIERETPEAELGAPKWTPRRRELLKWFRSEAPSLAPAYEAAVQLLNMTKFPAREHLIGHIVRDIYDTLPQILDGKYTWRPYGGVIRNHIDRVQAEWKGVDKRLAIPNDSNAPRIQTEDRAEIPWAAVQAIERLLETHRGWRKDHRPPSEVLARVLCARYAEDGLEPPHRLVKHFKDERQWFMGRAHLPNDEEKQQGDEGLEDHFASFEDALYSLVGRCFQGQKEIDDFLARANQRTD